MPFATRLSTTMSAVLRVGLRVGALGGLCSQRVRSLPAPCIFGARFCAAVPRGGAPEPTIVRWQAICLGLRRICPASSIRRTRAPSGQSYTGAARQRRRPRHADAAISVGDPVRDGVHRCLARLQPLSFSDWPSTHVKIIVPFPAGTANDLAARLYAEGLSRRWTRRVVVENKAATTRSSAVAPSPTHATTTCCSTARPRW